MSLLQHVQQLRALAQLDPQTSVLDMALINVIEELAEAVDRLEDEHPPPPDRGLGSI